MIDINGIAHIQLSVTNFKRSRDFYYWLLHETFGLGVQYDNDSTFYCIGGRTGIALTPVDPAFAHEHYNQRRVGLHHICFRLRSGEDVDSLHAALVERGDTRIVHAPEEGQWAQGYYSVLFEDPDGIRLEANFVPGRGNLDRVAAGPIPGITL